MANYESHSGHQGHVSIPLFLKRRWNGRKSMSCQTMHHLITRYSPIHRKLRELLGIGYRKRGEGSPTR